MEGSARYSEREYGHFVGIALGSASEVRYLVSVAARLDLLEEEYARQLTQEYDRVVQTLQRLADYLRRSASPDAGRRTPDVG